MRHSKLLALTAILFAFGAIAPVGAQDKPASGTVTIEQYQVAFIGSGNLGGGKLNYKGQSYGFKVGGLGIGGFGVSKITAAGTVYGLNKLEDFSGVYGQDGSPGW